MNLVTRRAMHKFGHIHALNWAHRIGLAREHLVNTLGCIPAISHWLQLTLRRVALITLCKPRQWHRVGLEHSSESRFSTNTIPLIDDMVAINLTNISVARKRFTA